MVLGKLVRYMQKNETRLLSYATHENLKWIKDLNVRPETIKIPEENIGSKISDMAHTNFYLVYLPRQGKQKKKKWDFIKLKSFCTAKKNINKIQTTHRMGEHIHQHEFTKHNTKKPNIPIKK